MIAFCDECGTEFEITSKAGLARPVANGYEPEYEDDYGVIFKVPHLNQFRGSCEATLFITRIELNI